jgi:hypothetical protein
MSKRKEKEREEKQQDREERRQTIDEQSTLPPTTEQPLAGLEEEDVDLEEDLAQEQIFDTQQGEGHTYNPQRAAEQGLTYTPPSDPPTVPSEDLEGAEIGAGFAPSMEDTDPDRRQLPDRVDNQDLDLQEDVYRALQYNSETAHLSDIRALVTEGVVSLFGTVPSEDDLARIYSVVSGLEGVRRVVNHLQVQSQ